MLLEKIPNGGDVSRFLRAYVDLSDADRDDIRPLLAPKWGLLDHLSMRTPPMVEAMVQVARACASPDDWQNVLAAQEHVLTQPDFCYATRVQWPLPEDGLLWGTVALLMVRKRMPREEFAGLYGPWESKIPQATIVASTE
jgi:hypothetical protein